MLQQLSPVELQSVLQSVGQVNPGFKSQDLGDLYDDVGLLPGSGVAGSSKGDSGSKDMFSRNEKWIGNPPTVNHKAWKSREDEILGWSVYLQELSSWASQGSVKFGREIELSSRWIEPIIWNRLSSEQQNRAVRLQALLSAAFAEHGRITLMVQGFQEGLDISPEFDSRASEPYGNRNGFELLRQLTKEFSLRNRAEALSLKTQLLARVFVPDPSSGSSQVSDVIRQIDLACARFMRMVGTLGAGMASGLQITDSDQLSLLVRSLPNDARSYALMHSSGESYQQYRISARRFENQHRLFKDLVPQRRAVVNLVEDFSHPKDESTNQELSQDFGGEGEEIVAGVSDGQGPRCMKCGSKRHDSSSCTTNLDKLKCFKCGQLGHASLNCRVKKSPDGKPFPSKGSGKSPQKGQKGGSNSSGKGSKGSSKGKKGKMFAVLDEDGSWWYTECAAEEESADAPQDGAEDENSGVLVLNCVLPQLDSLVVGDSLRHDCCSSDASSGADEENFDSDASLDANEESFDVDRLFDGVLHFDMAYDDFDEFEFEEMSPIRNITDLETVYNRNWSTADWGDSRDVEASLERALCQASGGLCETNCMSWGDVSREEKGHVMYPSIEQAGDDLCENLKPCHMLLNSVGLPSSDMWLLDSGASVSVVSRDFLKGFQHSAIKTLVNPLQAANGTSVNVDGFCKMLLEIQVVDGKRGNQTPKPAVLPVDVVVGDTAYPILSVCKLGKQGWDFSCGKTVSMIHRDTKSVAHGLSVWYDTPWIRVKPYEGKEYKIPEDEPEIMSGGHLKALTADELVAHRLRGHVPYEPSCEICQSCRGVHKHRRRAGNKLSTEVFADFGFLSQEGLDESDKQSFKFLVIKEVFSSSIGAVVVSDEKGGEQQLISKWFGEFGLRNSAEEVSVVLLTDSESAVSSMVANIQGYQFLVQKAPPQAHESVGHAERAIRGVKEAVKMQLLEFERLGYTLQFEKKVIQALLNYVCFSHNCFSPVQGSKKTPREIATGFPIPPHNFSVFGSKVLAELPQSLVEKSPNAPRFHAAAFLYPSFGSMGVVVMARIRVGTEMIARTFIAKSIKLCLPIAISNDFGIFVQLVHERSGMPVEPVVDKPPESVLPEGQAPNLTCPRSGPPLKWIEDFGITQGCGACKKIEIYGSRQNSNHSKKCCRRYESWLKQQVEEKQSRIENARDESVLVPSGGEASGEAALSGETRAEISRELDELFSREFDIGNPEVSQSKRDGKDLDSAGAPGQDVLHEHDFHVDVLPGSEPAHKKQKSHHFGSPPDPSESLGLGPPSAPSSLKGRRSSKGSVVVVEEAAVESPDSPVDDKSVSEYVPTELGGDDDTGLSVGDEIETLDADASMRGSIKRFSDTPITQLESEIGGSSHEKRKVSGLVSGLIECLPVDDESLSLQNLAVLSFLMTESERPCMVLPVSSIRFDDNATSVVANFGDKKIRIWRPVAAVDDASLKELCGEAALQGMVKEMKNLELMEAGDLYTQSEYEASGLGGTCRTIPSRWVCADKGKDDLGNPIVRSRIVLKDISKGSDSARVLGISSPTPSSDGLNLLLSVAGIRNWFVGAGDVSSAFMATPLRQRVITTKLPLSISSLSGEPLLLHLKKALNGLRSASQEWVLYLTEIVGALGLSTCSLEPCLFSGILPSKKPCMLLAYVDDIIACTEDEKDIDHIFDVIGGRVSIKRTGLIYPSSKGGQLKFLGRLVTRQKGDKALLVSLPEDYLDETFAAYNIRTPSRAPPDLTSILDREEGKDSPLSADAHAKLRSGLGKVAWLSQSRQDIRAFVSLIATQQSSPTSRTEDALRALLKFMKGDMKVVLRIPNECEALMSDAFEIPHVVAFSDASHAPMKSTGRRGVTGGVLTYGCCCIKTLSRHQQLVSLSSMESELHALQHVAQEMSALQKVIGRILYTFQEVKVKEVPGVLYSDSESALKLLRNLDVPRKSRHLEIRIEWIKERVSLGQLSLIFRKGVDNPSDLLTKCLGSAAFGIHRSTLGFQVSEGSLAGLVAVAKRSLVFIEVCCRENSAICQACRDMGIQYIGISKDMEKRSVFSNLVETLKQMKPGKVYVHVSSPCTSGSPLRNFSRDDSVSKADVVWFDVFPKVAGYLKLGDHSSFELPWRNAIWNHVMTKRTLTDAKHVHEAGVHLCATGAVTSKNQLIGKVLGFTGTSKLSMMNLRKEFGQCNCTMPHGSFSDVDWTETAYYNPKLAKVIVKGAILALTRES